MDTGRVLVRRTSERDIKMRSLEIYLDGKFVTDLAFGKTFEAALPVGTHELTATNRLTTQKETFELAAGESIAFETANVLNGCFGIMFSIFGIGPYSVTLRRAQES